MHLLNLLLQELLYKKLQELRKNICDEFDVPPHTIASTKTLIDIAKTRYTNCSFIFIVFCVFVTSRLYMTDWFSKTSFHF